MFYDDMDYWEQEQHDYDEAAWDAYYLDVLDGDNGCNSSSSDYNGYGCFGHAYDDPGCAGVLDSKPSNANVLIWGILSVHFCWAGLLFIFFTAMGLISGIKSVAVKRNRNGKGIVGLTLTVFAIILRSIIFKNYT